MDFEKLEKEFKILKEDICDHLKYSNLRYVVIVNTGRAIELYANGQWIIRSGSGDYSVADQPLNKFLMEYAYSLNDFGVGMLASEGGEQDCGEAEYRKKIYLNANRNRLFRSLVMAMRRAQASLQG